MEIKDILNNLVEHQSSDPEKYISNEEFKKIVEEKYEEKKAYQYLSLELNLLYSIIALLEEKDIISEYEIDEKLLELDPETYEKALKRHQLFKLKKELNKEIKKNRIDNALIEENKDTNQNSNDKKEEVISKEDKKE